MRRIDINNMANKNKEQKQRINLFDTFPMFARIVVILWLIGWLLIDCFIPESGNRAAFGDKFGAINALFSGLALAGVISTLIYQKEGLKLQNEEFEVMLKAQRLQCFETSLFNMLSLQQEIVKNLSLSKDINNIYKGRDIFEPLYNTVSVYNSKYMGVKEAIYKEGNKFLCSIPETTRLDHYFRHLYRIFKFINSNKSLDKTEKYNYTAIVRSQLSDYELIILFYNCLSSNGSSKFKPLIETYAVFKNIRIELLADFEDKNAYSEGAYKFIK